MVYINLPSFYWLNKDNHAFKLMIDAHPDWLKINMTISSQSGNFPYCYLNGSINTNLGKGSYYEDVKNFSSCIPLRINMANINITEDDWVDTQANVILKLREDSGDRISVSDPRLVEYIENKYSGYLFVLSKNIQMISDVGADFYNEAISLNRFDIIEISEYKVKDLEFLSSINNKRILELPINTICSFSCPKYEACTIQEQNRQYNFSGYSACVSCNKRVPYQHLNRLISIDDIKNIYLPMGICHFSVADLYPSMFDRYHEFLIDYFIKDEFKYQALMEFINRRGSLND